MVHYEAMFLWINTDSKKKKKGDDFSLTKAYTRIKGWKIIAPGLFCRVVLLKLRFFFLSSIAPQ